MTRYSLLLLGALTLSACATKTINADRVSIDQNHPDTASLKFIDLDSFDIDMSALMAREYANIEVGFHGTVSVNNIPQRLQQWLSPVEQYGKGVTVQHEQQEFIDKSIALAVTLLLRAIPFVKDGQRNELVKPYSAELSLPVVGQDNLSKVVFIYHTTTQ